MNAPAPNAHALSTLIPHERVHKGSHGETHYWVYGADDAPTIVALHGFRGDHHGVEPIIAHLAGYRVVVPDLPGFGSSSAFAHAPHSLDTYVAWLNEFVTSLELGSRPIIVGHSFGSIVTSAAVARGLDTPALILVNPIGAPALQGPRAIVTRLAVFYYWLATVLPERMGFALLRNPAIVRAMSVAMAKTRDTTLRRFIHDQHGRYFSIFGNRRVVLEAFDAAVRNTVAGSAPHVMVPTLLVASDKDDVTALPAQRRLVQQFPHAQLRVISGAGHLIHYEAPAEAAQIIHDFLAALPQAGPGSTAALNESDNPSSDPSPRST